jgi:cell division ATPase FtsA
MNNTEIFFNLNINQNKINLIFVNKDNKNEIISKNYNLSDELNDQKFLIDNLNNILKDMIIELEKKINNSVNKINLMIEKTETLSINACIKENFENKEIYKNNIEYLIQDLRQQILKNNSDIKIAHILVNNCIVNGEAYNMIPIGKKCQNCILEINFICFPKNFIQSLENLFANYQIEISKIICTNYAKSLLDSDFNNLLEAGIRVVDGFNLNEVILFPKKMTKVGFFERLFHIFS